MPVNFPGKYHKILSSRLFRSLLIILFVVILVLFDKSFMNTMVSAVILALAGAGYWLCYYLWVNRKDNLHQASVKLSSRVIMALSLMFLSVFFAFFSYQWLIFEPFSIMCRFGSCAFGPYGWAAALLSLACALLFIITSYLLVFSYKDRG